MDLAEVVGKLGIDTNESGYYDPFEDTAVKGSREAGKVKMKSKKKRKLKKGGDDGNFSPNQIFKDRNGRTRSMCCSGGATPPKAFAIINPWGKKSKFAVIR